VACQWSSGGAAMVNREMSLVWRTSGRTERCGGLAASCRHQAVECTCALATATQQRAVRSASGGRGGSRRCSEAGGGVHLTSR
jgi:hypothetical protein